MWSERLPTEDDLSSWTARDECWEVLAGLGGDAADGSAGAAQGGDIRRRFLRLSPAFRYVFQLFF